MTRAFKTGEENEGGGAWSYQEWCGTDHAHFNPLPQKHPSNTAEVTEVEFK